jgi:hypothetical protein
MHWLVVMAVLAIVVIAEIVVVPRHYDNNTSLIDWW